MTTSGSYDATNTMTNIIYDAFSLLNAHDSGETLDAADWVYAKRVLNDVMRLLSVHKGLWLVSDVEVTLTPGTASYSIGTGETIDTPYPMRVTSAYRSESVDIPIEVVGREEYIAIPNKTLQAPATMVYYHRQRASGTLHVWPTGTSTDNTIYITTQRPIQDFDSSGNNPDLPVEWHLLIKYMLAKYMAPKYIGGVVPQGIKDNTRELLVTLSNFDEEEAAIEFQV